jgi:hypothetical protein
MLAGMKTEAPRHAMVLGGLRALHAPQAGRIRA